ncbi:hypothetical protein TSUD_228970 [Trifolium subterraneum]|uniref:NERD domain-containing protein n=1 Tax=Trifolium subterraneum TaxID=3900 RepID=A0A2Z6ML36_TRISU|nr:hypothetical protein TSUD_228970 [Trifolium subterraneum]
MWPAIICGLILYKLFKCFFYDDDVLDIEASDSSVLFSLSNRLEKLFGGKVFVGLRIPDADSSSPQTIDLVLLTKRELLVISVKNFSGILTVQGDGTWVSEKPGKHSKVERHSDPVEEVRKQASILEAYLEQRGVVLPKGFLSCKVILPNPKLCTIPASDFPSEVITHEQLVQLKPGTKNVLSSWVKSTFVSGKDMQESGNQNLEFVLITAPIWDSNNSNYVILSPSTLQVLYTLRDYRTEGASALEWNEVTVRSSTEIIFQVENASKIRKFKLSSVSSMHLSA